MKNPNFTKALFAFDDWHVIFAPTDELLRGRKALAVDIFRAGLRINSWIVRPTCATRTGALALIKEELEDSKE